MIFTSLHFVIFYPIVALIYFALPFRFRWLFLLVASCYFYMAFIPMYILILFSIIIVDYIGAIFIEKNQGKPRMFFLFISCAANLGALCVFKYFNFFNENIATLFHLMGFAYHVPSLTWALPIGLSFHVFQSLSYTIDVYYGYQKAERHPGIYALYVMFFPQLVAGPIERSTQLLPQLKEEHHFEWARLEQGTLLIVTGFLKKIVIADRLGVIVDTAFRDPTQTSGIALFIATVFFAFQIYADFSAYTNIARGAAAILGVDLMENFDCPFFSASIGEFWRRWHISLSTWLRDYVFVPICMQIKRPKPWKQYAALLATFFLSGLWHGANWTFIMFGMVHGIAVVFETIWNRFRQGWDERPLLRHIPPLPRPVRVIFTFFVACIGWVFFRSPSMSVAMLVFRKIGVSLTSLSRVEISNALAWFPSRFDLTTSALFIVALLLAETVDQRTPVSRWMDAQPAIARWVFYYACISTIIVFGRFQAAQFIYFQF